jgi:ADP-heptose:LPS heptosyltransferase
MRAATDLRSEWQQRLDGGGTLRVGIVWAGNPRQPRDPWRSTRLANFAPLAAVPGIRLVSLQKGAAREQLACEATTWNVLDFGEELDADAPFVDTAALIECLDLVISVDTAVAHLAGAMQKPVWLALQFAADWRWGLSTDRTPWYPSMRLFRQRALHDWPQVFADMAVELRKLVAQR